jgi:hypothetical protein
VPSLSLSSLRIISHSHRAVAVARVPPTALTSNGAHQNRMYLAGILESSSSVPSDGSEERVSEEKTQSESVDGQKVYKIVAVTKSKQLFR